MPKKFLGIYLFCPINKNYEFITTIVVLYIIPFYAKSFGRKMSKKNKKSCVTITPIFIFMVELSGGMGAVEVGDNMPAESL